MSYFFFLFVGGGGGGDSGGIITVMIMSFRQKMAVINFSNLHSEEEHDVQLNDLPTTLYNHHEHSQRGERGGSGWSVAAGTNKPRLT